MLDKLLESKINKTMKLMETEEVRDRIQKTIEEINKRGSGKRFLTILTEFVTPTINIFFSSSRDNNTENKFRKYFTDNTDMYIFKYDGFQPNAFTIPGNIFPASSHLSVLSAGYGPLALLTFANYIVRNITTYKDVKPEFLKDKINLNIPAISVFYSDAFMNRGKFTEEELLAILMHEIGHNAIKKTHINFILIMLFTAVMKPIVINKRSSKNPMCLEYTLIALLVAFILIFNISRRNLEYKSDEFSTRMGFGDALKSGLEKAKQILFYGSEKDNIVEKIINFLPRQIMKLINILSALKLTTYPSFGARYKNIDSIQTSMATESLREGIASDLFDKIANYCTNILLKFKN